MKVTNSYKVKLVNVNSSLDATINVYRDAITYIIEIVNNEWKNIESLTSKDKNNYIEKLIHKTKKNPNPIYADFDKLFYKLPSYLRRSAIQDAIGIVSSYKSNLANYEAERYEAISNGKKFKKKSPNLQLKHFKCPALYKGNMYNRLSRNEAEIKVFKNNDWVWQTVKLREQDVKYIEKRCKEDKEFSPILVKSGRKYYLQFSYEKDVKLNDTKVKDQIIVAVDLGLNTSAVCSAIKSDGTVIGRKFIDQPIEKDRQKHLLNRLKLKQKQTGKGFKMPRVWNRINNLNNHIVNDTANKIISFALECNADVIVFEYLNFTGKKPKHIAMKMQMWAKREIQEKVKHKAHSNGIRYRRVNTRNTSKLAYDGSGKVIRDKKNAKLCTFATGKQYNCDLNASYNIGARYFIKEAQENLSEKKWSQAMAKVPELGRRTQCTLSTLISLHQVM